MKNLLFVFSLIFGLFAFSGDIQAQSSDGGDFDKAVKLGPLGFILGSYNATFEKKLKDKASFVVGGRFSNYSLNDNDYTAFSVNGQYRIYFKEAIAGPYLAPSAGIGFNSTDIVGVSESFTNIGIGANIGWQWVAGGGFVVDLGIGVRYRNGFGDSVDADFSGIGPSFQVQIGYAF